MGTKETCLRFGFPSLVSPQVTRGTLALLLDPSHARSGTVQLLMER